MDRGRLDAEAALSKLGGDLSYFLQRCTYLVENPAVPPPVGTGFRWDNRSVKVFTSLLGAILEVWASGGGQDIRLPDQSGATVELELFLAREPGPGPGRELLLRASTRERLEKVDDRWRWSLAFTGASIDAGVHAVSSSSA